MQSNLRTLGLAAAVVLASTAIASAQGSTDRNGNAMGSEHVGSGGGSTGAMRNGAHATTGMSSGPSRNSPNGSPGGAPKAKAGPQGDSSKDEDAPR